MTIESLHWGHYSVSFCKICKIAANGLRIGDGGAFEKRQPNICTNAQ